MGPVVFVRSGSGDTCSRCLQHMACHSPEPESFRESLMLCTGQDYSERLIEVLSQTQGELTLIKATMKKRKIEIKSKKIKIKN